MTHPSDDSHPPALDADVATSDVSSVLSDLERLQRLADLRAELKTELQSVDAELTHEAERFGLTNVVETEEPEA